MRDNVKTIDFDKYEIGIIINALNQMRTLLISQEKDTSPVDELLLKVIDAPEKKLFFRKMQEAR